MADVTVATKQRREAFRQWLAGKNYHKIVHDLLEKPWTQIVQDESGEYIYTDKGEPVIISHVAEYSAKCDKYLKLLNKVLPDLRALDLTGTIEHRMPHYTTIIEGESSKTSPTKPLQPPADST